MKKWGKRILPLMLSLVFILSSAMAVSAEIPGEQDGIVGTFNLSKLVYDASEEINVSITVKNTGDRDAKDITALIQIPEGLEVRSGNLEQDSFQLSAGQEKTGEKVVLGVKKANGKPVTDDSMKHETKPGEYYEAPGKQAQSASTNTGDHSRAVLWTVLAVFSGAGLISWFFYKKNRKSLLTLLLIASVGAGLIPGISLHAEEIQKGFSISQEITAGGKAYMLEAKISYTLDEEAKIQENAIYVSKEGNDSAQGTKEAPVQTLEKARDLARLIDNELPTTIYIRGGEYVLNDTFTLEEQDGGTAQAPVVYRAYPGETVILTGNKAYQFSSFGAVEESMKALLPTEAAKEKVRVLEIDLEDLAVSMDGTASNFMINAPMLMMDDHSMVLTRYPNSDSNDHWMMAETIDPDLSKKTAKIQLDDETVAEWSYRQQDYIYWGYFAYGWAASGFQGTLDTKTQIVTAADSVWYGSSAGEKPVRIFNAYESLDEPGEWYYDKEAKKLYVYPFEDTTSDSLMYIATNASDMIRVKNASYVTFEGLTLKSSKGSGIVMDHVDHCSVNNCRLLSFKDQAVSIDNAEYSGIRNSEIAYSACTAIYIDGGDYQTITPAHNYISNNVIHDTNQYRTFNEAGVRIRGVGVSFDHNEVYNITDMAVNYAIAGDEETSVDTVIEYNVFHDCITNGKDMGAVYGGRDARCQGTIVRYNHFYNLGNDLKAFDIHGAAVYADDGLSGVTVTGNIFGPGSSSDSIEAFKVNCGHDHKFIGNLCIDMPCMFDFYIDSSFETRMVSDGGYGTAATLKQVWKNEKYTERCPWMKEAAEGSKSFYIQNIVKDNVLIYTDTDPYGGTGDYADKWYYTNGADEKVSSLEQNKVIPVTENTDNRTLFEDYANGNYALKQSALEAANGYVNIDQSKIGLETFIYDGKELIPGGSRPSVSEVTISGTLEYGKTVKAEYKFADKDGSKDGATYAEFYIADSANEDFYLNLTRVSDNTTKKDFVITMPCEGKYLYCKVVPVNSNGMEGTPVWSAPVKVALGTVDKTALQEKITEAEELIKTAIVGTEDGQWSQKEVDRLMSAIAAAKALKENENANQYEVNLEVEALKAAIERFKNNRNGGVYALNLMQINALIADEENWISVPDFKQNAPTFKDGEIHFTSTSDKYSAAGYQGESYTNKVFSFRYRQTGEGWGGFALTKNTASAMPWANHGVLVTVRNDKLEMQIRDGKYNGTETTIDTQIFADGKDHDVIFGMYNENSTDVRIVLTVDGTELYNKVIESENLHSAPVYFSGIASSGNMNVSIGSISNAVDVADLIADEENWSLNSKDFPGNEPAFADGTVSFVGKNSKYSVGAYNGKSYQNKSFNFKYCQTGEGWGGFFLKKDSSSGMPWSGESVLVTVSATALEMQIRDGNYNGTETTIRTDIFADGKNHEVSFGVCDEDSTDVRITLSVDGTELYNKVITSESLNSAKFYFGGIASPKGTEVVISGIGSADPVMTEVSVKDLLKDSKNWTSNSAYTATAPKVTDGAMVLKSGDASYSIAGYSKEKYKNTLFKFNYSQTLPETDGKWGGFYVNLNKAENLPWADKGLLVCVKKDVVEMQIRDGVRNGVVKEIQTNVFSDGEEHEVVFGMYDESASEVRVILKVDGQELYSEKLESEMLHSAEGYFGALACPGGVKAVIGTEPLPESLSVFGSAKVTAENGEWTLKNKNASDSTEVAATTYTGKLFENEMVHFKYSQVASGKYGGFHMCFSDKLVHPWMAPSVSVLIYSHKVNVVVRASGYTSLDENVATTAFADGTEHDVSFGVVKGSETNHVIIKVIVDGSTVYEKELEREPFYEKASCFSLLAAPQVKVTAKAVSD